VHALKSSALLTGRGEIRSTAQWNAAPAEVVPYRNAMKLVWDPLLPATSQAGSQAALPTSPVVVTVNGVDYSQSWYLGRCRQQAGSIAGSACENPDTPDPDPTRADVFFIQVVVAVTWRHRGCTGEQCTYVVSTLVSPVVDPIFNVNRPPPVVNRPPDQLSYVGVATTLQVTAVGGWLPLTWTATGLPGGLSISTGGLISGTPNAAGTFSVTIRATDRKSNTDTDTFTWTVINPLALTSPGNQVSRSGTAVSLPITATGGARPLVWSATGLPAGLSINTSTGVIAGTPTTLETKSVTVTATETNGQSQSVTFTWRILTLTLVNPGTQTTPLTEYMDLSPQASGGVPPYTWRADNLPEATIDPSTGRVDDKAWRGTRFVTTIYVADSAGDEVSATFIWNIPHTRPNELRITSPNPASPDRSNPVGQSISSWLATTAGGSGSGKTWSTQGLPPGITTAASGSDLRLSGTPTTRGTYLVRLTVRDNNNIYAYMMFYWTIT